MTDKPSKSNEREDDGPFPSSIFPKEIFPHRIFPWMGGDEEEEKDEQDGK